MKKYKINVMKWNLEKYNTTPLFYQKFQILLLMENANTHLVSIFKDYLLYDDSTEFFKEYYIKKEIYPRLKTIYDYYESSSYLFPNYTAINEGKYIYRNIIRKQKLIDYLEDLEDKKKEKEEKKNLKKKKKLKNQTQNEQSSSCIEVFDTKIYENIRKETENDSKINELFCVGTKNSNNDCDSFASILKLTEELKEKEKDSQKKNIQNKEISNKTNKETNSIINKNINNNNKKIIYNLDNLNKTEGKIYVSRRVSLNQNTKVYNKKTINKGVKNLNINNFINNNNSGLIVRNFNLTDRNKNINKLNIDTSKSNDFIKNNQNNFNSNKNIKNNYKKNNIIINIINSNKNNNYNSTNNYFSNYTNTNTNTNENNNQNNHLYFNNLSNTKTNENKSNFNTNSNPRINTENNKSKNNITIGGRLNSKGILTKPQSSNRNHNNNSKNIQKNKTKQIKSKLLSFRLTDSNFVKNIAERIKNKANSSSMKKNKNKSKTKSIFSPNNKNNNNNNNIKKRTKTEILGNNTDIFIIGQQGENYTYNKSINRQILKNINLTNNNKPHKEISLVNKKIINYHLNINNNNININNSNSINKKCVKHTSTNSQNLTDVKIINKIVPFTSREFMKKKDIGVFSVNKTERTSRNHSKDKINKINNTTVKKNYLDSFSPKKTQDLIYNKIHKIQNKKNDTVYTFLKSISSNKKMKNLKIKKNNYSSINNNTNSQGINSTRYNKELHKRINSGKNY